MVLTLTHLIFELRYCAMRTFPKKSFYTCGKKISLIGDYDLAVEKNYV